MVEWSFFSKKHLNVSEKVLKRRSNDLFCLFFWKKIECFFCKNALIYHMEFWTFDIMKILWFCFLILAFIYSNIYTKYLILWKPEHRSFGKMFGFEIMRFPKSAHGALLYSGGVYWATECTQLLTKIKFGRSVQ